MFGNSVGFSYLLENIGNRLVEPRGSIRIFNRRGEEVGSVPLNADGSEINPENKEQLAAVWNATGRFGKYKAFLDLEYGENQLASVQDTLYFWVFPWKEIFTALAGVLLLGVVGTYIVHMRAIASPVPARSKQRSNEHGYQDTASLHTPRQTVAPVAPVQVTQPVTAVPSHTDRRKHLAVSRVTARTTVQGGSTVDLSNKTQNVRHATRSALTQPQQDVKVTGNVVQLSSRRK